MTCTWHYVCHPQPAAFTCPILLFHHLSSLPFSWSEYHLQVHLYRWVLRSLLKVTSGPNHAQLSEDLAQPFLTLHTSPSELVSQQECSAKLQPLKPVITLLSNSFTAIHELMDESNGTEQCSYHGSNVDRDVSRLGELCIYNGLSLATLMALPHSTSPFEVAEAEYRAVNGLVSSWGQYLEYFVHTYVHTVQYIQ